ncbi:hypothetical protein [Fontivita pretiosa]|uniref:hypothetical protein n=1 Tax=Fontivita pretiosa TaxID=2989684 RepID=UPI003D173BA4
MLLLIPLPRQSKLPPFSRPLLICAVTSDRLPSSTMSALLFRSSRPVGELPPAMINCPAGRRVVPAEELAVPLAVMRIVAPAAMESAPLTGGLLTMRLVSSR